MAHSFDVLVNKETSARWRIDKPLSLDGLGTLAQSSMAAVAAEYTYRPALIPGGPYSVELYHVTLALERPTIKMSAYNGNDPLVNGIVVTVKDGSDAVIQTLTSKPITKLMHWSLMGDVDTNQVENGVLLVRWEFEHKPEELRLNGHLGEYLSFSVGDDLSSWTEHIAVLQGRILEGQGH